MNLKERAKAFSVHLSASVVVGLSVFGLIWLVWYPPPLLQTQGVLNIFVILLVVDVVAGPALTFLVFNREKKSLKFDLAVIVVLQLSALLYGLNTVYQGRPVYLVYNVDKISVVSAADLVYVEGETVPQSDYLDFPAWGPELIGTLRPKTREQKNDLLFSAISAGRDLDRRVEYYVPIESVADEIKHWLRPLDELIERSDSDVAMLEPRLEKLHLAAENVGYLPVAGGKRDCVALIDRATAEVLTLVLLTPPGWEL